MIVAPKNCHNRDRHIHAGAPAGTFQKVQRGSSKSRKADGEGNKRLDRMSSCPSTRLWQLRARVLLNFRTVGGWHVRRTRSGQGAVLTAKSGYADSRSDRGHIVVKVINFFVPGKWNCIIRLRAVLLSQKVNKWYVYGFCRMCLWNSAAVVRHGRKIIYLKQLA